MNISITAELNDISDVLLVLEQIGFFENSFDNEFTNEDDE